MQAALSRPSSPRTRTRTRARSMSPEGRREGSVPGPSPAGEGRRSRLAGRARLPYPLRGLAAAPARPGGELAPERGARARAASGGAKRVPTWPERGCARRSGPSHTSPGTPGKKLSLALQPPFLPNLRGGHAPGDASAFLGEGHVAPLGSERRPFPPPSPPPPELAPCRPEGRLSRSPGLGTAGSLRLHAPPPGCHRESCTWPPRPWDTPCSSCPHPGPAGLSLFPSHLPTPRPRPHPHQQGSATVVFRPFIQFSS